MKKELFLLITSIIHSLTTCCPFEFSLEDSRPFFEQYETDQKENTASKDSAVKKEH